jgi:hypothetical protein
MKQAVCTMVKTIGRFSTRPIFPVILALSGCLSVTGATILGSAQSFAVLGHSTVTSTGQTTINGDLGTWPGTSITTGGGSLHFIGGSTIHNDDAVAQQALDDEIAAYNTIAMLPVTGNLGSDELGGLIFTPGVYRLTSSAQLTGTITLDAQNIQNALFVFQIPTTLTTASNSNVHVINGSANDGLYWQVGSSATLGTGTNFAGNILALDSITLTTGASILCGRALAQTAAVTMDTNVVSNDCTFNKGSGRSDFGSYGFSGPIQAAPEPETFALISVTGTMLAGLFMLSRIRQERATLKSQYS